MVDMYETTGSEILDMSETADMSCLRQQGIRESNIGHVLDCRDSDTGHI